MTDKNKFSGFQQNSEFLVSLLMQENKHINPVDFIFREEKASNYSCVCVSLGIMEKYDIIRDAFKNSDEFSKIYFDIYLFAIENYHSIVGGSIRQILVDEAKIFYPDSLVTNTIKNLVSNTQAKQNAYDMLDSAKAHHCSVMILRDEIAFVVIHYEGDDFIVIDPHIECCGILSKNNVYRYLVYDGIWDFDVHTMIAENQIKPMENENVPVAESSNTTSVGNLSNENQSITAVENPIDPAEKPDTVPVEIPSNEKPIPPEDQPF